MVEEWRKVAGFDRYEISSLGRLRSTGRGRWNRGRIGYLRPIRTPQGYMRYDLTDGKEKRRLVFAHRLIAENFHIPGSGPFVNHIDGNKNNNWIGNLEWCTFTENMRHAFRTGLIPLGSKRKHSVLSEVDVVLIRFWKRSGLNLSQITAKFGGKFKEGTINGVFYDKNWRWLHG